MESAHIICLILARSDSRPYHVSADATQRATRFERLCGLSFTRRPSARSAPTAMAPVSPMEAVVSLSHGRHSEPT